MRAFQILFWSRSPFNCYWILCQERKKKTLHHPLPLMHCFLPVALLHLHSSQIYWKRLEGSQLLPVLLRLIRLLRKQNLVLLRYHSSQTRGLLRLTSLRLLLIIIIPNENTLIIPLRFTLLVLIRNLMLLLLWWCQHLLLLIKSLGLHNFQADFLIKRSEFERLVSRFQGIELVLYEFSLQL